MFKVFQNFKKRRTNNNEAQIVDIEEQNRRYKDVKTPPDSPSSPFDSHNSSNKKFSLRHIITPKRKKRVTAKRVVSPPSTPKQFAMFEVPKSPGCNDSFSPTLPKTSPLRKPLSPITYQINQQARLPQSPAAQVMHRNFIRQFGTPLQCPQQPSFSPSSNKKENPFSSPTTPQNRKTVPSSPNTLPAKHFKQQQRHRVGGTHKLKSEKKNTLGKRKGRGMESDFEDENSDHREQFSGTQQFGGMFMNMGTSQIRKVYPYCLRVFLVAARSLINTEVGFKEFSNPYVTMQVGDWRQTSSISYNTLFPTYNQTFSFLLNSHRVPRQPHEAYHQVDHCDENFDDAELILRVFDHDNLFDHCFMGRKTFSLAPLLREAQLNMKSSIYNQWIKLEGVQSGEVHVVMIVEQGINFGF